MAIINVMSLVLFLYLHLVSCEATVQDKKVKLSDAFCSGYCVGVGYAYGFLRHNVCNCVDIVNTGVVSLGIPKHVKTIRPADEDEPQPIIRRFSY